MSSLTTHRLNFILAQRAKSNRKPLHQQTKLINQSTPFKLDLGAPKLQKKESGFKNQHLQELRPYHVSSFVSEQNKKNYQSDILDSLITNRSMVDNMSELARMQYKNCRQVHNECLNTDRNTKLQFYNHQKQGKQNTKKIVRRSKAFKITKTNAYLKNLDDSMHEISNNLSQITFQLAKNTRNLEKLHKMNESIHKKPTQQEVLRRVNFKYAPFDEERERYLNRKQPRLQYEDKVYKDPKYIIWNPLH